MEITVRFKFFIVLSVLLFLPISSTTTTTDAIKANCNSSNSVGKEVFKADCNSSNSVGKEVFKATSDSTTDKQVSGNELTKAGFIGIVLAAVGGGCAILAIVIVGVKFSKSYNERKKIITVFQHNQEEAEKEKEIYYFAEVISSLDYNEPLEGKGNTYRGKLGKTTVAIKHLKNIKNKNELKKRIGVLSSIKDLNLAKLLGFYFEDADLPFLMYEFVEQGSLYKLLHENCTGSGRFDWLPRLKLMNGIVKGIRRLHLMNLTHGNLKSKNVLVDVGGNAKLIEYGLYTTEATGYCPKDLTRVDLVAYSEASDFYALGVLILEIVSGKQPVLPLGADGGEMDLAEWVQSVPQNQWSDEVIDQELCNEFNGTMVDLVNIGLSYTTGECMDFHDVLKIVGIVEVPSAFLFT